MQSNTQQFELLLTLKLRQIHNAGYGGISYDDLYRMFVTHTWKSGQPRRLSELADDVLNVSVEEVVRFLATESKIEGYRASLSDFVSLIEKEEI